ncbi:MAG: hypothetical protein IJ272_10220 [Clostridia bacterium]|nr:hypothetical protein [Clostridia bacterium]
MANIKSRQEIKEMYDVQNIVTACILGSQTPFTEPEMVKNVEEKLEGSSIKITQKEVQELVEGTIMSFRRIKLVTVCNGKYFAYPTDSMRNAK